MKVRYSDVELDLGALGEKTVEVKWTYFPGERATRESPGEQDEFIIESATIYLNGNIVEISNDLTDDAYKEIQEYVLDMDRQL